MICYVLEKQKSGSSSSGDSNISKKNVNEGHPLIY